jgi:macrophage erythroblast attacher
LLDISRQVGSVEEGMVKDPTTGEVFPESDMKKVYIL